MSVFSDVGKTVSSACRAMRASAELVEISVGPQFLTGMVISTGKIVNTALDNAAMMGEEEAKLEMERFQIEHQAALTELRRKHAAKAEHVEQ